MCVFSRSLSRSLSRCRASFLARARACVRSLALSPAERGRDAGLFGWLPPFQEVRLLFGLYVNLYMRIYVCLLSILQYFSLLFIQPSII